MRTTPNDAPRQRVARRPAKRSRSVAAVVMMTSSGAAQERSVIREGDVSVSDDVRIHFRESGIVRANTTLLFVPA